MHLIYVCIWDVHILTGAKDGHTMKELQYPNAMYDNVAAVPYVQYNQSASESNVVGS